jgi:hypothetical protein
MADVYDWMNSLTWDWLTVENTRNVAPIAAVFISLCAFGASTYATLLSRRNARITAEQHYQRGQLARALIRNSLTGPREDSLRTWDLGVTNGPDDVTIQEAVLEVEFREAGGVVFLKSVMRYKFYFTSRHHELLNISGPEIGDGLRLKSYEPMTWKLPLPVPPESGYAIAFRFRVIAASGDEVVSSEIVIHGPNYSAPAFSEDRSRNHGSYRPGRFNGDGDAAETFEHEPLLVAWLNRNKQRTYWKHGVEEEKQVE